MRLNRLLTGLISLAFGIFILSGCLNEDNKIPPNCYDGELNNNELRVDCGGPCPECPPTCSNGVWDVYPDEYGGWVEEDIDCGGPCEPCPTCDDLILNQGETGIDCGGLDEFGFEICVPCPPEAGDCTNGILDGDETGIDCGGCCCPDCPEEAGDCTNGVIDGDEDWWDCGGCCCPDCPEPMISFTYVQEGGVIDLYNAFIQFDATENITSAAGFDYPLATIFLQFNIDKPLSGWQVGNTITFDDTNATDRLMEFNDNGEIYTSDDPEASVTLQFTQIDELVNLAGTEVKGVFNGVLNLSGIGVDEDVDFTIAGGTFTMIVVP